ncbi:MAG TPA: hypothetical protein VJ869_16145 [Sphaerochaeta sp.]|nr:hypothetical protein [Sphaerochaeta sp.]
MTKEKLWELRQEIVLNSLYYADYENSMGYTTHSVCDFFDGYLSYIGELMEEDGFGDDHFFEQLPNYNTMENLWNWYGCFETSPFEEE